MIRRLLPTLMLILILPACGSDQPPELKVIRPVRYQEVRTAGGGLERSFAGTAKAGIESRLSFRVPGSIEKVAVKVGDRVEKGDLIARLDDTDYRLQVQEALAALANARAQSRNADATYERVRALYENRNASRNDLDAARAASESAEAAMRASATRLELTRSQLSYTRLTAPVSGAIAAVPSEVNENVSAGQIVVILTSGALPEVISAIPESLISLIRRDMPVTVRFDALGDRTFPARVTEVGVAAISRASTFPVTVRLEESYPMIRPGMAAEVTFPMSRTDGAPGFLVPPEAVGEDRQGRFVMAVEPIDKELAIVQRRAVTVGELRADGLVISAGLKKGDRVVTAGASRLHDGQKVRLLPGGGETP